VNEHVISEVRNRMKEIHRFYNLLKVYLICKFIIHYLQRFRYMNDLNYNADIFRKKKTCFLQLSPKNICLAIFSKSF